MPTLRAHTYDEAIAHLSSLVPELFTAPAKPGTTAVRRKFSLDQIAILTTALGNPQASFQSFLIAGTNGKGSTASTLASIATAAGLRTGLYTSPHLERVNERIKLSAPGGALEDIPDEAFARIYFHVHDTAQRLIARNELPSLPSYFELLTAIAFCWFAESQVDLAILEVGMGGRLDATNIVSPILSVITDIALDHQEWLGSTIAEIAREKAGILRPNATLITLPQHPEANQALGEVATGLGVRGINAAQYTPAIRTSPSEPYQLEILGESITIDSPLHGAHQHRNLALAIAAAVELNEALPNHNHPITAAAIAQGIRNTRWPARLETIHLPNYPEILLDVAHNPAGAWALRAALNASTTQEPGTPSLSKFHRDKDGEAQNSTNPSQPGTQPGAPGLAPETWETTHPRQILVFSCLRDKPLTEMAQILFPIFDHLILVPIHSPRATPVADLAAAAEATGTPHTEAASVEEAIQLARQLNPARIVISGSLYLVGEARALLLHPHTPSARQFAS
jgi:dihydrofolate synthase / folylpolyglutamate synthase